MAEALISAAAEVTLSEAISIVEEQINLQRGFKDELNDLLRSLTMTRAFLKDAETRQVNEPLGVWLEELREIASKADDALDELAYEDLRRNAETQMRKKVSNFFSISKNPIVFSFKMSQIVKGINISLKKINDRARDFGLQQRVRTLPPLSRGSQTTHSFIDSSQVVGRKADVSNIIDLLIRSSTQQIFSIVSIVGMGGLGKTTLAKSVCNSKRTTRYFDKIMWVCVSENFDVERILQEMFQSLTGQKCDMTNRSATLEKIQKELEGKTYLLALDDVWDEEFRTWEDLKDSLVGINKNIRSSILVTTPSANIAIVRDTPQENRYLLMPLGEEECFEVIRNRAFPNSSISSELEAIGRDIACKCGGVPLVANVIGGVMSNKWNIDEWVSLRDGSHWGSLEKNDGIIDVLKLSFDRLPSSSLKQCFAYCSIFPKDILIEKDKLIQLWMAEGFLQQVKRNSQLAFEDIGNKYFNDLLSSSLLQDVKMDLHGSITGCKMHDLVHDLAQSIRNSETGYASSIQLQNEIDGEKLSHSLFSKSSFFHIEVDFKHLRVLNFCGAKFDSLPGSIGRLKHLRYFDVSNTRLHRLPKSITRLYNLQTLRMLWCFALRELPKGMKNLVSLRHLVIDNYQQSFEEIKYLTNLRTLPIFHVGTKRCRIGVLGYLSELGGELEINNLQNVRNKKEAQEAKIWRKNKLHTLTYVWDPDQREGYNNDENVLEGLEPHSNLKSLAIVYYKGENNPSWLVRKSAISASFQSINLVHLSLRQCWKLKNVPTLGLYPNLKFLEIVGLKNVRCIGKEFYINNNNSGDITLFPALEEFTLWCMGELEEWLDVEPTITVFPSLKLLRITSCPNLSNLPATSRFSSLDEIYISDCKKLSLIGDGLFPSTLNKLEINTCRKLSSIPSVEGGVSFLQQLYVHGCSELSKIEEGLLASICLRDVSIKYCPNLTSIPLNSRSESLLKLELNHCNDLREIESGLSACTRLEELLIKDCPNLISIPSIQGFSSLLYLKLFNCQGLSSPPSGLQTSTSLRDLCIEYCQNLKRFPKQSLGRLTRLKKLTLGPFSEELEEFPGLSSIHSSLEELTLKGRGKLSSLPDQLQHLTALKRLMIWSFSGVKALPEWLGDLSSLRVLHIKDCKNLEHLPSKEAMQRLSNLETLELGPFSGELEEFPGFSAINHLHSSLQDLTLVGWEKLSSLPDQLQHFTALSRLSIRKISGMKALPEWLGNLSSLRQLYIRDCENLAHLSSKEAMQCLSNLRGVAIESCPLLKDNRAELSKIPAFAAINIK
ncbi:hypothetical protein DITRI_Ditri15bG0016000 [Diplodiscus trichospermus]